MSGSVLSELAEPLRAAVSAAGGDGEPVRLDRPADPALVAVQGGGVDVPVPGREGLGDDLLHLIVGDLVHAESQLGDPPPVAQEHRRGELIGRHPSLSP